MTEEEALVQVIKSKSQLGELFKSCSDSLVEHQKELRETLRGIAVLSSAIAVGALVLLSSDVAIYKDVIFSGIVFLFFETFIVTCWLLYEHGSSIHIYNRAFKLFLNPLTKYLDELERCLTEKVAFDESVTAPESFINSMDELLAEENGKRAHYLILVCITFLGLGLLLILLGLIGPQFCQIWGVCVA